MPALRWILLLLYIALIGGLFALGMWPEASWFPPIQLAVTVAAQAMFILGAGHKELCRPIRRPRLLFPVVAVSFMLAVLVVALTWAISELFKFQDPELGQWALWSTLGASWLVWGLVLFVYTRSLQRYQAIFRLAQLVFIGSLAELLAAVPSHLFVTKRGGCFAGIATGLGIMAGLFVMIWSFGPAIFLLFLHEAQRRKRAKISVPENEPPKEDSPAPASPGEVGGEVRKGRSPFQYSLRALMLLMLATGVLSGVLRAFWGLWPAAAFASLTALVLLSLLLLARPRLPILGLMLVLPLLVWAFWGDWTLLTAVVLPLGTFAILLVKQFARRLPADLPVEDRDSSATGGR